jgi:hypothetical protein
LILSAVIRYFSSHDFILKHSVFHIKRGENGERFLLDDFFHEKRGSGERNKDHKEIIKRDDKNKMEKDEISGD